LSVGRPSFQAISNVVVSEDGVVEKKRVNCDGKQSHGKVVVRPANLRSFCVQTIRRAFAVDAQKCFDGECADVQVHKIDERKRCDFKAPLGPLLGGAKHGGHAKGMRELAHIHITSSELVAESFSPNSD
jgi:hypothetical protein